MRSSVAAAAAVSLFISEGHPLLHVDPECQVAVGGAYIQFILPAISSAGAACDQKVLARATIHEEEFKIICLFSAARSSATV